MEPLAVQRLGQMVINQVGGANDTFPGSGSCTSVTGPADSVRTICGAP